MSINSVITSDATVEMYVFIRVVMPAYGETGLYSPTPDSFWPVVESGTVDGKYIVVYSYSQVLTPGASTTVLADTLSMVEMSNAEYAEIEDINVTISAYACGAEGIDPDAAWESVKENYGL